MLQVLMGYNLSFSYDTKCCQERSLTCANALVQSSCSLLLLDKSFSTVDLSCDPKNGNTVCESYSAMTIFFAISEISITFSSLLLLSCSSSRCVSISSAFLFSSNSRWKQKNIKQSRCNTNYKHAPVMCTMQFLTIVQTSL